MKKHSWAITHQIEQAKGCLNRMEKLEKARVMICLGKMVENVELDPDPKTQDKLTKEYNCKNCDSHNYCCKLAATLK